MVDFILVRIALELIAVFLFAYMVMGGAGLPILFLQIRSVLASLIRYADYAYVEYPYREEILTLVVLFTFLTAVSLVYEKTQLKKKKIQIIENLQQVFEAQRNHREDKP